MNLVAFPHYTCGGLLCDIFNNEHSKVGTNGGINNYAHSMGKFGDTGTIFDTYDSTIVNAEFLKLKHELPADYWIGTHCWPKFLDLSNFKRVISVTTETYRSKVYRWVRACYHYYESSKPWQEAKIGGDMAYINKSRETAKNYLVPFKAIKDINQIEYLEFSDIVECSPRFLVLVDGTDWQHKIERWKSVNSFLYSPDFWNNSYVKRFHEGEYETQLSRPYVYY